MTDLLSSSTPRRDFITRLAIAGTAVGLTGSFAACAGEAQTPAATPTAMSDPQLEAWFGKITGKHKQVFDAPMPHDGLPAIWPKVYQATMAEAFGGEATTAVLILRHDAIPLAMEDPMWAKYPLGQTFKINDPKGKPAMSNIYASITGMPITGIGVRDLIAGGTLVGVCGVALSVYSGAMAEKMKMPADSIRADWVANLIPGVQVVPSGVMAVARAQELGCTYCFAG